MADIPGLREYDSQSMERIRLVRKDNHGGIIGDSDAAWRSSRGGDEASWWQKGEDAMWRQRTTREEDTLGRETLVTSSRWRPTTVKEDVRGENTMANVVVLKDDRGRPMWKYVYEYDHQDVDEKSSTAYMTGASAFALGKCPKSWSDAVIVTRRVKRGFGDDNRHRD